LGKRRSFILARLSIDPPSRDRGELISDQATTAIDGANNRLLLSSLGMRDLTPVEDMQTCE
jgi:hypothetical protein